MKVAVVMGSKSDLPVMQEAVDILRSFGIETVVDIVSAHRTLEKLMDFGTNAHRRMLSTVKFSSVRPSLANSGVSRPVSCCDSRTWLAAMSRKGMPEVPKAVASWVTARLRSCCSSCTPV